MIGSDEFSELVLYYDSREQSNVEGRPRVKRIIKWFEERGGTMISEMAIPLTDYVICGGYDEATKTFMPGTFRGKEICLGTEYKTMQDYSGSASDLDWKLIEAYKYFTQVALFVEEGEIGLSFVDGKAFIKNPCVPGGKADVTVYEHYKNEIDRFSQIADIHVRTFPFETFIDVNFDSLMILLSEEPKVRLYCRGEGKDDAKAAFITALLAIPKIGVKTALKFTEIYPNLETFCEHASYVGEFEKIAGTLTGKRIRAFIKSGHEVDKNNNSRANQCFIKYRELFPLTAQSSRDVLQCPYLSKNGVFVNCDEVNGYQCIGDKCRHHPDFKISQNSSYSGQDSFNTLTHSPEPDNKSPGTPPLVPGILSHSGTQSPPSLKPISKSLVVPDDSGDASKDVATSFSHGEAENSDGNAKYTKQGNEATPDTSSYPLPESVLENPPPTPSGSDDQQGKPKLPAVSTDKVIKSLDDAIVDLCFDKPKSDTEILSAFQYRGFEMSEIHKTLLQLAKTKMHKFRKKNITMYAYVGEHGIRAMPEMDVGV